MKRIDVIIDPQGQSRLSTHGFVGKSCQAASKFLEQALGETAGEQRTAEYYQTDVNIHNQERSGP